MWWLMILLIGRQTEITIYYCHQRCQPHYCYAHRQELPRQCSSKGRHLIDTLVGNTSSRRLRQTDSHYVTSIGVSSSSQKNQVAGPGTDGDHHREY